MDCPCRVIALVSSVAEAAHDGDEDEGEVDVAGVAVVGERVDGAELGLEVREEGLERGGGVVGDGDGERVTLITWRHRL